MMGIMLDRFEEPLFKVSRKYQAEPILAIDEPERKLGPWLRQMREYDESFSFSKHIHRLPVRAFNGFSFDEICKTYYSSQFCVEPSFEELFKIAPFSVMHKIKSSHWRWGCGRGAWNEVVCAYDGIRAFDLGLPGFDVYLDHTTGYNERGYSEYARVFLDGVFGYQVYYRDKHVMTIGFSIAAKKRLLIHQVQLVKQKGNRFLYQWPRNRLEFIIERFRTAFPKFSMFVIDVQTSLDLYKKQLANRAEEFDRRIVTWGANDEGWRTYYVQVRDEALAHVAELQAATGRLVHFYNDLGRFTRMSECHQANQVVHHAIA